LRPRGASPQDPSFCTTCLAACLVSCCMDATFKHACARLLLCALTVSLWREACSHVQTRVVVSERVPVGCKHKIKTQPPAPPVKSFSGRLSWNSKRPLEKKLLGGRQQQRVRTSLASSRPCGPQNEPVTLIRTFLCDGPVQPSPVQPVLPSEWSRFSLGGQPTKPRNSPGL
jgi:hypothetical protein